MGLLGTGVKAGTKAAKGLMDIIDNRTFFHNTDSDVSGLLEARPSRTGEGIFGLEVGDAKYGAQSIPFKVRGKIAGTEVDKDLNAKIKEATGLSHLEYDSAADAYTRLKESLPELEVQAIFKDAGYGGFSRKAGKRDIVQAFDADTVMQMDTSSGMARAKEQGYNKDVFHYSRGGEDIEEIREGDLNLSLFDALGIHTGSKEAAAKRAASTRSRDPNTGKLIEPSGPTYPLKIKHQKPFLNKDGKPYTESELHAVFTKMAEDKNYGNIWDTDVKQKLRSDLWDEYDVIPYVNEVEDAGNISYISPPAAVRSKFAEFDPAKSSSSNILASGVLPTTATGLMGYSALKPDSARAAEIANTDIRDVGSIQAANYPALQKLAGLLGGIDTPLGKPFENIPNSLLAMAYGDEADLERSFLSALDVAP